MILPSKHDHPDLTVVAASTVILRTLKRLTIEKHDRLRGVLQKYNDQADPLFLPALMLLHGLGLVEYHIKTDSFVYVGRK